ncbi:MAG: acyl transferase, partial [Saprospiraceae bacterium]
YAKVAGRFYPAPPLKIFSKQITDPLSHERIGKTGLIAIMDLMNVNTLSFLLTQDIGRVYADGSFDIQGRVDGSDLRGCNLLIQE